MLHLGLSGRHLICQEQRVQGFLKESDRSTAPTPEERPVLSKTERERRPTRYLQPSLPKPQRGPFSHYAILAQKQTGHTSEQQTKQDQYSNEPRSTNTGSLDTAARRPNLSASEEEVQAFTGLNNTQWTSFLNITQDKALSCVAAHPGLQWSKHKASSKIDVFVKVNDELVEEGIHRINDSAIDWRMHQVVRDIIRKESTSTVSRNETPSSSTSTTCQPGKSSTPPHKPSAVLPSHKLCDTTSQPYEPSISHNYDLLKKKV
ncbi:hypothetical protein BU25DRAFT_446552 [Macroventuria anomochaeta]|uniref:Uncharacterized protein n=1 Tax=Macroventuria anomochaeta TaxID=301207 RepID=A0ACB6SAF4_9PLEO|nr:uncharacterized protein BU25DRAFT_446552 [Macroventuria anomochaeta]KAF2630299.1 hypothetical protein BU25DRAFT_446552 [Macroventuria anomochaeta]